MTWVITSYSMLFYLHATASHITNVEMMWLLSGTIIFHIVGIIYIPYTNKHFLKLSAFIIFALAASLEKTSGGLILSLIVIFGMIFIVGTRVSMEYEVIKSAKNEYRLRSSIAPAHFVRKSNSAIESFEEFFKPEMKYCVCVYHRIGATIKKPALIYLPQS